MVALASATPAGATQAQPQQFETIGQLIGPGAAAGTWAASGLVEGAGTYTERSCFAGRTIRSQKVLVSAGGTIVLEIRGHRRLARRMHRSV
jgi:hypothetical protein